MTKFRRGLLVALITCGLTGPALATGGDRRLRRTGTCSGVHE